MMCLPFKWQALSQCVPCGSASLACNWEASVSFQLLTAQIDDVIWSLNMATLLKTRFSLRHWPWHLTPWRTSPLFDYHRLPIPRARHPCKLWGNLCLPPVNLGLSASFFCPFISLFYHLASPVFTHLFVYSLFCHFDSSSVQKQQRSKCTLIIYKGLEAKASRPRTNVCHQPLRR